MKEQINLNTILIGLLCFLLSANYWHIDKKLEVIDSHEVRISILESQRGAQKPTAILWHTDSADLPKKQALFEREKNIK